VRNRRGEDWRKDRCREQEKAEKAGTRLRSLED